MLARMRRVFPLPEHVDVAIEALYSRARTPHSDGRPAVELCMISTPDGAISVDGRSGPLGNPTDAQVLATLRGACDVVLVGAGTIRAEKYTAPSRRGLRIGVVSRTGNVDTSSSLFSSGSGFLIVPESAQTPPVDHIVCGDSSVDFNEALRLLASQFGARFVHVEGGPQINAELMAVDCVDAINLTIAPWISGGMGEGIATNSVPRNFALEHLCVDGDHVFARYVRATAPQV